MKVGSGRKTCYWGDRWLTDVPLVFAITTSKGMTVAQVRTFLDGAVSWDMGINRRVQDHVVGEISSLLGLLDGFLSEGCNDEDYRVWMGTNTNGKFTVKSCYFWLISDCPSRERFVPPNKIY